MSALRWVILAAVVAIAGLLLYLATSDPTERVDPVRDGQTLVDRDRTGSLEERRAEEAEPTVYRADLGIELPGGGPAPHAAIEIRGPVHRNRSLSA